MDDKIAREVDRLLHDAVQAFGGHEMAQRMNDPVHSRLLLLKAATKFAEALKLDPKAETAAWAEA